MAVDPARVGAPSRSIVEQTLTQSLGDDLGYLLSVVHSRMRDAEQEALGEYGVSIREYTILAYINDQERSSQHNLARLLEVDPSQVVGLVDSLQSQGYVERQVDPQDRRTNAVVLTDEGKQLLEKCSKAVAGAEKQIVATLSQRDHKQLLDLLRRVAL